mmetsp:Transcript_26866/g.71291  ORF Transcript_26866/g.71291 Transcript_26866/m.71291 type:complete len:321 (+) Transcript_26866:394-1356(+)
MPAAADMLTKMGEVPQAADSMVAAPQTTYTAVLPGTAPSWVSRPAMRPDPVTAPLMENRSNSKSAPTCTHAYESSRMLQSNVCGLTDRRAKNSSGAPPSNTQAHTVAPSMPIKTAPLMPLCCMEAMMIKKTEVMAIRMSRNSPNATMSCAGPVSGTTTPIDFRPMSAERSPVPMISPYLMQRGTKPSTTFNTGVRDKSNKDKPQAPEMARAWSVPTTPVATRLNAKKTLGPIEGIRPRGKLLSRPERMQATPAQKAPLTTVSSAFTPACCMMVAFTTKLFAAARNAVVPARNSVEKSLPRCVSAKYRSSLQTARPHQALA